MKKILLIISLLVFGISFGQTEPDKKDEKRYKPNPYKPLKSEPYQFFKFKKFKRHFDLKGIDASLDSLEKKSPSDWSLQDSLRLLSNLAKIKDYDQSYEIYNKIGENRVVIYDYELAKDLIYTFKNKDRPDLSLKVIDVCLDSAFIDTLSYEFMSAIHQARLNEAVDWRWLLDNSILEFPTDTILPYRKKNDAFYTDSILLPLEKLDAILKDEVLYTPKNDPIISEVFYEIGFYLEHVGSNTQAYIAYSLGKLYNRSNNKTSKRIRIVKDRLISKKYRIPGVRKYFPKYEKGRFNYELLKKKILEEQLDTIPQQPLPTMQPVVKKDLAPKFPKILLLIGALFLVLIFVLFFVKTKK